MNKIQENEEFKEYLARLERHRKIIEHLVGPTADKKSYHLPGP